MGAPCGVMDQMAAAMGRRRRLLALSCRPAHLLAPVVIPSNLRFWGVDSGAPLRLLPCWCLQHRSCNDRLPVWVARCVAELVVAMRPARVPTRVPRRLHPLVVNL